MLSRKLASSITVLLALVPLLANAQTEAPRGESDVENVIHRVDLVAGQLVGKAIEPPPVKVRTDPASLPEKLPPKAATPPHKLHPRLLEWIKERDPADVVEVVVAFEDREKIEIPRFPDLNPGVPRDHSENEQALAVSEALVRELQEKRAPTYARRQEELAEYRAEVVETFWLVDAMVVKIPLGHIPMLALHGDVESIVPVDSGEPPPAKRDGDLTNDIVKGRNLIGTDPYYSLNEGNIGLLDSGLRFTHSLLVPPAKVDLRRDCVNGDKHCKAILGKPFNPVDDCMDHGTAAGAILVSNGKPNGVDDETVRGVTAMTLDSFKVFPSVFTGGSEGAGCIARLDSEAATRGFQAAVAALDKVIVAEMQGALRGLGVISKAANAAFDAGALVIAANGNSAGKVGEPASASRVLGVGAVGVRAPHLTIPEQGFGPTPDGRVKPDIQAPTKTETASNGCNGTLCAGSDIDFKIYGGTSGATPYAAGAAALLRNLISRATGRWSVEPGLVYAMMILSGQKVEFDDVQGTGLIFLPNNGTLRWGSVLVREGETLEIPLLFDPPQARLDAAIWWPEDGVQCRHNDVDLLIANSRGTEETSSRTIPSVFERVGFEGTMQGRWSVRIQGYSFSHHGPQKVYFSIFNRPARP